MTWKSIVVQIYSLENVLSDGDPIVLTVLLTHFYYRFTKCYEFVSG